jgi:hypothetical protein
MEDFVDDCAIGFAFVPGGKVHLAAGSGLEFEAWRRKDVFV